jgi:hypothetical protein
MRNCNGCRARRRIPLKAEGFGKFGWSPGAVSCRRWRSPALDLNQLTKLAKAIDKARANGKSLDPLTPFRLAFSATRRSI